MNNQIKLLKYLKKNGADIEEKNINIVLKKLGIIGETPIYSFLNALAKISFIEWRDARPTRSHSSADILMYVHDENSPLDYRAEITLTGLQYLREDELKRYNKWTTVLAVVVAIITALIGWYYSDAAKDKDEEISELKAERADILALENARSDSIKSLKIQLVIVNKSFAEHLKNDSLDAVKPTPVRR